MTTKTKHAPVPWEVEPISDGNEIFQYEIWRTCSANRPLEFTEPIIILEGNSDEVEANAAFIVKAVNCHDELLEALKIASKLIAKAEADGVYRKCVNPNCGKRGLRAIKQAIAKAEGK